MKLIQAVVFMALFGGFSLAHADLGDGKVDCPNINRESNQAGLTDDQLDLRGELQKTGFEKADAKKPAAEDSDATT
jgi:hypothetical protein